MRRVYWVYGGRHRKNLAGARTSRVERRAAWAILVFALVLLVANDSWLKSGGHLPPWLTGKLSDFAGLTVLPVALTLTIGHRSLGLRRLVFVAVLVWFAAINLSTVCSALWVGLLAEIGLSWQLWPDPSDLLALVALPLAWRVAGAVAPPRRLDRSRLFAVPAAVACLASGNAFNPVHGTGALFVYNNTRHIVALDVAHVPWLECDDLDEFGEALLERGDFQPELFPLAPAAVHSLYPRACGCDLYRVTAGGRSIVVRVPPDTVELDRHPTHDQFRRNRERMIVVEDGFSFRLGSRVETVEVAQTAQTASCKSEPRELAFTVPWALPPNGVMRASVVVALLAVEPIAGNCFDVTFQRTSVDAFGQGGVAGAAGESGETGLAGAAGTGGAPSETTGPEHMFLCAPMELFPFVPGDVVSVSLMHSEQSPEEDAKAPETFDALTLEAGGNGFRIRLGSVWTDDQLFGFQLQVGGCGPRRDEQGPPWLPVTVFDSLGNQLVPDKIQTVERGTQTVDVYLGRGRQDLACWEEPSLPSVEMAERWSQ